jgi:hypothetical protein
MIKKITGVKVLKLELSTTPLPNVLYGLDHNTRQQLMDLNMRILSWYHNKEGIDANTSVYKKWDKVTELLGGYTCYVRDSN